MLRPSMTKLASEGILLGNAYLDNEKDFILKRKAIFIKWSDIEKIEIKTKLTLVAFAQKHRFIHITNKKGVKENCYLVDEVGFIKASEKLNKRNLIVGKVSHRNQLEWF